MADDFQNKFDEVKRSYIANLKEKKQRLYELWSQLTQHWNEYDYEELYRIVHSIAGGAETFGFAEATQKARSTVELLRHTEGKAEAIVMSELAQRLNELHLVLEKATETQAD